MGQYTLPQGNGGGGGAEREVWWTCCMGFNSLEDKHKEGILVIEMGEG